MNEMDKSITNIILIINEELGIDLMQNSKRRQRIYVFGRAILYKILRKHLNMTLSDIAKVFNKNHATVLHSLKHLPFLLKFDKLGISSGSENSIRSSSLAWFKPFNISSLWKACLSHGLSVSGNLSTNIWLILFLNLGYFFLSKLIFFFLP